MSKQKPKQTSLQKNKTFLVLFFLLFGVVGGFVLWANNESKNLLEGLPVLKNASNKNSSTDLQKEAYGDLVSTVLQSNEDLWKRIFFDNDKKYKSARILFFESSKAPNCPQGSIFVHSLYCPKEKTIYLSQEFFDHLYQTFSPQIREMTGAYIVAHQVSAHVQNLLGITPKVGRLKRKKPGLTNVLKVRQDIQADCLAGMWAHSIQGANIFDNGEIAEAMNTLIELEASEVFDPALVQDRLNWFNVGYKNGEFKKCNTFKKREKPRIQSIR